MLNIRMDDIWMVMNIAMRKRIWHAWQRRSPPSLFPPLILTLCPKEGNIFQLRNIFQISLQIPTLVSKCPPTSTSHPVTFVHFPSTLFPFSHLLLFPTLPEVVFVSSPFSPPHFDVLLVLSATFLSFPVHFQPFRIRINLAPTFRIYLTFHFLPIFASTYFCATHWLLYFV